MNPDMEEARKAMIAKRFGGNANGANTGGAVRRKHKAAPKSGGGNIFCTWYLPALLYYLLT